MTVEVWLERKLSYIKSSKIHLFLISVLLRVITFQTTGPETNKYIFRQQLNGRNFLFKLSFAQRLRPAQKRGKPYQLIRLDRVYALTNT